MERSVIRMERSCPLSRFRPLIPVHAIFDLEFLSLFVLYLTVRWTPLLGDLLALGFFPIIHIICLWGVNVIAIVIFIFSHAKQCFS